MVKDYLRSSELPHAIVNCRECITGRHLLEQTISTCLDALPDADYDASRYARCENLGALAVQLQALLENRKRFALVFDHIDKQREAPPTLLAALARFGEMVRAASAPSGRWRKDREQRGSPDLRRYPTCPSY